MSPTPQSEQPQPLNGPKTERFEEARDARERPLEDLHNA
jgi:hypothetical protein